MNQTITKYIKTLRLPAKRAYALALAQWIKDGSNPPEPRRGALHFMQAESIRLSIYEILRGK